MIEQVHNMDSYEGRLINHSNKSIKDKGINVFSESIDEFDIISNLTSNYNISIGHIIPEIDKRKLNLGGEQDECSKPISKNQPKSLKFGLNFFKKRK